MWRRESLWKEQTARAFSSDTRLGPEEAGLGRPGGGTPERSCGSGVCLGPRASVVDAVLRNVGGIDGGRSGVLVEGA